MKKNTQIASKDVPFLAVLLMFAGFSLYGILSFNGLVGEKLDQGYTAVLSDDLLADGGVLLTEANPFTAEIDEADEIFADVPSNHSNSVAISYFKQMGYIGGYDDGSFRPDQSVNRAELFKVLTNALNVEFAGGTYENCFKDVEDEWFATYICYAKIVGWVDGKDDGTFEPAGPLSNAAIMKIVVLAFNFGYPDSISEKPFSDVEVGAWYAPYAYAAKDVGIYSRSLFKPNDTVTRGTLVQYIYNALEVEWNS